MLGLLLGGCASTPPEQLGGPIADSPTPGEVQTALSSFVGHEVRWGGEILDVRNASNSTDVEVYARPLYDNAEPKPSGGDGVRFLARVQGFLDPVDYAAGKRLTVRGRLSKIETRLVGEYPYRYPLVMVEASELWPEFTPAAEPAWYRDPYWDPWGPWGHWGPYRRWPYGW